MDIHTDGRNGHLRPTLLGRLGGVDLKILRSTQSSLVNLSIELNTAPNIGTQMETAHLIQQKL